MPAACSVSKTRDRGSHGPDAGGRFGRFPGNAATLEFAGGADPAPCRCCSWTREGARLGFLLPCHAGGSVSADWSSGTPAVNGTMNFSCAGIRWRGVAFSECSGGAAYREGKLLLRDLRVAGDPGLLSADLMIAPGIIVSALREGSFPPSSPSWPEGRPPKRWRSWISRIPSG